MRQIWYFIIKYYSILYNFIILENPDNLELRDTWDGSGRVPDILGFQRTPNFYILRVFYSFWRLKIFHKCIEIRTLLITNIIIHGKLTIVVRFDESIVQKSWIPRTEIKIYSRIACPVCISSVGKQIDGARDKSRLPSGW